MSQIITLNEDKLTQDIERRVRGKFNKDLLLNTFFEHTEEFSPAANNFLKTGKYSGEIYNSKKYNIFWERERERCLEGFENPKTKVWIPGKYYFFLNYKHLSIIPEGEQHKKRVKRITTFPKFWPIHYFYMCDYDLAVREGLNLCVLKPRDTGFSELLSSNGVHEYTFQTEDPVFYFVAVERFLIKDGVLTKAWDQLNFLNEHTERAFKHLRQVTDQSLHKRASFIDPETRLERKTGGQIIGAVVDNDRKLRGARGHVNFEEFGSFPHGEDAWMTAVDLAQQQGVAFAMITAWGTGGEQGPGIAGLEKIFMNPDKFNCLPFENCWEPEGVLPKDHGFFFPSWATMTKFMDKWGNTDFDKAREYREKERVKLSELSQATRDKRVSQQPFCPSEALMRLAANPFPIEQLQRQLRLIDSSPDVRGMLKVGENVIEEGKVIFKLNPKLDPINVYPHVKDEGKVDGALTVFESPLRDNGDKVPAGLYYIVADCFMLDIDQATDWESLGSFYVYKKRNTLFPTEDDILVAWYSGRPARVKEFHRKVFLAARYYNAVVQTEIKGGGQELLNYAKDNGFLEYCGERPSVFNHDKEFKKMSERQFFVKIEKNNKPELLVKLADWLMRERSLKIADDKTQYTLNLERIYDRGLLEELIKFNIDGNFDRISCLLVLMATMQEAELQEIVAQTAKNRDHIFNRTLYSNSGNRRNSQLSVKEMLGQIRVDGRNNDLIM